MALFRCSVGSGGGGDTYAEGSKETATASTEYEINTGLTSIDKFFAQGYDLGSGGYQLQSGILYDADDSGYFQSFSHYSAGSNSVAVRQAFTSTSHAQCFVVVSVSGGKITIKTPTTAGRATQHIEWLAK